MAKKKEINEEIKACGPERFVFEDKILGRTLELESYKYDVYGLSNLALQLLGSISPHQEKKVIGVG